MNESAPATRRMQDMFTGAAVALLLFSGTMEPTLVLVAAAVLLAFGFVFVARDRRMAAYATVVAALAAAAVVAVRAFIG